MIVESELLDVSLLRKLLVSVAAHDGIVGVMAESLSHVIDALPVVCAVVPPCRPGDDLYIVIGDEVVEDKCAFIRYCQSWMQIQLVSGREYTCWTDVNEYFGKTIFKNRQEAEMRIEHERLGRNLCKGCWLKRQEG